MRCLLITITRNRRGQPIREGRVVSGEVLTIGRASDSSIYLPNARVNLHHATLRTEDDGRLVIEANNTPIGVNGTFAQRARLRPNTHLTIGPYELGVELAGAEGYPEHDFALTVELQQGASAQRVPSRRAAMTLAEAGLRKRIPSLLIALIIGVLFLAFPILHATKPEFRAQEKEMQLAPVLADESWSPGALAAGHRGFGRNCSSCHSLPFVHVRDQECLVCHETTGNHIQDASLQKAAFDSMRCAECHRDHRGLASMTDIDPVMCVQCHGSVREKGLKTALPDISDFKTAHPPFKLSLRTGPLAGDLVRVSQEARPAPRQSPGLKFPHDIHLAKRGIESPMAPAGQNGRVVLGCRDCHLAEESGVGFKPVSMERQCASCHRLEFEPDVTSRQVPHGSERNVMLTLREFYASEALGTTPLEVTTVDGLLRRPPMRPLEVRQRQAADWANEKALHVATDLFEVRVCVVCHEVSRTGEVLLPTASGQSVLGVPWKVAPVVLTQHFMPKASFEHAKHAAIDCLDCHKVTQSKNLAEVAMPEIGKCRECHVGAEPETHKISSNCELCHGFHRHSPPTGIKPSAAMVAGMPQSGPNAVSAGPRVVLSEPK